jgi:hypothetical protein
MKIINFYQELRDMSRSSEEDVSVLLTKFESAVISGNHTRAAITYIEKNGLLQSPTLERIKFHDVRFLL